MEYRTVTGKCGIGWRAVEGRTNLGNWKHVCTFRTEEDARAYITRQEDRAILARPKRGKKPANKINREELRQTLKDAYECLTQYHAHNETMQPFGQGFFPTGTVGQSIDSVMRAIQIDAKKLEV